MCGVVSLLDPFSQLVWKNRTWICIPKLSTRNIRFLYTPVVSTYHSPSSAVTYFNPTDGAEIGSSCSQLSVLIWQALVFWSKQSKAVPVLMELMRWKSCKGVEYVWNNQKIERTTFRSINSHLEMWQNRYQPMLSLTFGASESHST